MRSASTRTAIGATRPAERSASTRPWAAGSDRESPRGSERAGVGEQGGVGPGGDRAPLVDRQLDLLAQPVEQGPEVRRLVAEGVALDRERRADRDEPLLGAVVQVALDPLP